eukprot:g14116.t1
MNMLSGGSSVVASDINVLVVDDSAFMRNALSRMIGEAPGISVVGKGRNGKEAVDQVRDLKPDLLTLDIEMPEMDGLTALRLIRQFSDLPVLMVSSLTTEGSLASLRALRYGASDVLAKDHSTVSANIGSLRDDLINKIHALVQTKRSTPVTEQPLDAVKSSQALNHLDPPSAFDLIAIGASTGAPPVLEQLAKAIPKDFSTPVLIAQHMPAVFTASLAERLDTIGSRPCVEARHGMSLKPGMVAVAPGGMHTRVVRQDSNLATRISDMPEHLVYKPSVDELFDSAVKATGDKTLGIVLTGMGADGREGAKAIQAAGGKLITQSARSCVVYGMPKAVDEAGCSNAQWTKGYESDYWLTYKQAKQQGGQVRKGEKSSLVVFWKSYVAEDRDIGEDKAIPVIRHYNVFNAEQCDGMETPYDPAKAGTERKEELVEVEPIVACERVVEGYKDGPVISSGGVQAFYRPLADSVQIPKPERFESAERYYATLFHELAHSTGHSSRLDRGLNKKLTPFGSADYSREELIAEMGAAFLAATTGISPPTIDQSAAYINGWRQKLEGNKRLIIQAAGAGQRAADHILDVKWS